MADMIIFAMVAINARKHKINIRVVE